MFPVSQIRLLMIRRIYSAKFGESASTRSFVLCSQGLSKPKSYQRICAIAVCISCGKVTEEEKYLPLRSVRYRLPPRSDLYYEGGQQGRERGGGENFHGEIPKPKFLLVAHSPGGSSGGSALGVSASVAARI